MLLTSSEELIKTYEKELTSKEIIASIKQGWTGMLQLVLSQVFRKVRCALIHCLNTRVGCKADQRLTFVFPAALITVIVAPGEEFRAAFAAARSIGCFVVLGDRPISITLSRTWASLSLWCVAFAVAALTRTAGKSVSWATVCCSPTWI